MPERELRGTATDECEAVCLLEEGAGQVVGGSYKRLNHTDSLRRKKGKSGERGGCCSKGLQRTDVWELRDS